jgi:hypothetical protein
MRRSVQTFQTLTSTGINPVLSFPAVANDYRVVALHAVARAPLIADPAPVLTITHAGVAVIAVLTGPKIAVTDEEYRYTWSPGFITDEIIDSGGIHYCTVPMLDQRLTPQDKLSLQLPAGTVGDTLSEITLVLDIDE